jgi:hypothetical protein
LFGRIEDVRRRWILSMRSLRAHAAFVDKMDVYWQVPSTHP